MTKQVNPIASYEDVINSWSQQELHKLYLKVNLPDTLEAYERGNGEGMWAIPFSDEDKSALDTDAQDTRALVILCNDSVYYPPLQYGTAVQVEMRPGFRPVLDIEWMQEQLAPAGFDFKKLLEGKASANKEAVLLRMEKGE